MAEFDWQQKHADRISSADEAMSLIKPGNCIFIGTGCAQPQHLVRALVEGAKHVRDAHIVQLLAMGEAPYADEEFRERFKTNSLFIADNVRDALAKGIGDYTPIFLSDVPEEFTSGRIPVDVALISVAPPDRNGLCSLGVSVDIVKSAAASANYVIAQVNARMPRALGDSSIHIDKIDALVPYDEPIIEVPVPELDETLRRIGDNIARLVEDGSTIECGAITCAKKTLNRGKVVASFCMGSQRLYDYIDGNEMFEFHPTEYVNDMCIIGQHEKMVAINVGLEIDLTGQVCADSLGYRFYSGIGGQVDFIRGAARSRGGKAIIAIPSTARNGETSRIVAHLTEGAGVVTTRGDVHYVVTEYGIAYLHGRSIRERVLALINIAHPKFRHELMAAAKVQKYIYEDQIDLGWDTFRYPEELEKRSTLKDGTEILFRPVKPTDEPALSEMLYSLSETSVRTRYFTHRTTFPHRDVQQITNIDYRRDIAIVGAVPGVSEDEVVALGQYFLDPKTKMAEVAFLVQDEWQRKGMGTLLLEYLTQIATGRGVKGFSARVLPENKPMLSIFEHSGYEIKAEFDGDGYSITYDLTIEEG